MNLKISTATERSESQVELFREATIMGLYVAVVEIAELAPLPERRLGHGEITGPVGSDLLAIVWGTALSLALAHWFAFRIAAAGFRGDRPSLQDQLIGLGQVGGAALVAALSSLPILFLSDDAGRQDVGIVPS